ncbi:MAG: hypothetical protein GWN56_16525 [Nitrosopumilaceae archaeon]|nr:hypothetical protein [Nitrosopumilaceae archaeon]
MDIDTFPRVHSIGYRLDVKMTFNQDMKIKLASFFFNNLRSSLEQSISLSKFNITQTFYFKELIYSMKIFSQRIKFDHSHPGYHPMGLEVIVV